MKYKFETKDKVEAEQLINASENHYLLWYLDANFHRQFEPGNHVPDKPVKDEDSYYQGIYAVLDKLKEHLEKFKNCEE